MGASSTVSNVSEVGIVSYSLQKLLIFFMILDAAWMVLGYSFLAPLMSFVFHFLVLQGVKRGKTCILLIYVVFNVLLLTLAVVGTLFAIGVVMTAPSMDDSSTSEYPSGEPMPVDRSTSFRSFVAHYIPSTAAPLDTSSASSSSSSATDSYSYGSGSSAEIEADNMLLAGSIFFMVSVIILYCKIYSVILAARLRRLLLATPVLPVHVTLPVDGVQEQSDSDDKPLLEQHTTFDDVNPVFTQPGFVPMQPQLYYPNIQGAPSMLPPPFMYGQHPVFYTFAPASPTSEKQ